MCWSGMIYLLSLRAPYARGDFVAKKNAMNDGVKNAREKQGLDETLRMPRGVKKPKKTQK
jgi:hypothetical protein